MGTMQVYASELRKFTYGDKAKTILVAGEDIVGVPVLEVDEDTDPSQLVGEAAVAEPQAIPAGSEWLFRADRAVVPSKNGGLFAFLTPRL